MIIANFEGSETVKYVSGLYQYNKGQVLQIMGLNLPRLVEIDFSFEETGVTSKSCPAITKDGITEVAIPNEMLVNQDTNTNYNIYAFVYITDANVGETVKKIVMQVRSRTKPEQFEEVDNRELFEQAIEAVNQSDKSAEGWAHGREDMPERATDNAKYYSEQASKSAEEIKGVEQSVKDMVATIDGIEQQVQDVKEYAGQAKSASEKALLSEQEAKKAEEASLQHRTGAETAENNAEVAEQNAKKSEQAVEQAKQLVMQMGQEVLQDKNQVAEKVEEFNKTVKDASDAIETVKTDAMDAVGAKGTEQTQKVSDEGTKQVKAVEDKGNEILQSIPQDFTTQMKSKLDKQQGAENKGKNLVVGEDGNITVGEVQGGDGIPIINDMSGESPLVIPDSAERVNKGFGVGGNTEQLQTTGAQLFDAKTVVRDMVIESDGNLAYGKGYFTSDFIKVEPSTTYLINRTASKRGKYFDENKKVILTNSFSDFNPEMGTVITTPEKASYIRFSGVVENIKTIMLNKGGTAIPYEPYTGGKPSPSTEYQQEIKNVGKWNEETRKYEVDVKVTGKNVLNMQKEPDAKGIYQGWKVGDEKKKITLSIIDKGNNKDISDCYFGLSGNGENSESEVVWCIESGRIAKTKMTSLNPYVTIFPADETTLRKILERFDVQCEFGEIQTEYQPYKEQTLTLTSDRPITKWDKLAEQDGQIGWLHKSNIIKNFNGVGYDIQLGKVPSENIAHFTINFPDTKRNGSQASSDVFVDKFKAVANSYTQNKTNICCNWNNGVKYFSSPEIGILTVDAFSEWLKTNPIHIAYETEMAEFVPLPQYEQDAIRALKTYYPTTVIIADGGEVDPDIEVTYIADTKNYIDQKIEATNKSVVATQKALL